MVGYTLLGGDFFDRTGAFCEQMTVWRASQEKKNAPIVFQPKRHDSTQQFWREFPTVFNASTSDHVPGIVRWIILLQHPNSRCLNRKAMVRFRIASVGYGDKDFFVTDTFSDEVSFHVALLDDLGQKWRNHITDEIHRCEKLATAVGRLASDLAKAAGSHADAKTDAVEQFYFQIDVPFRQWLYSIDPDWDGEQSNASRASWRNRAQRIARDLGRNLVEQSGPAAFIGRSIDGKEKNKQETQKLYYAAPKAYNAFLARVHEIYQEKGGA